jgi:hypothetical protein
MCRGCDSIPQASVTEYPITKYQPTYFVAEDFVRAGLFSWSPVQPCPHHHRLWQVRLSPLRCPLLLLPTLSMRLQVDMKAKMRAFCESRPRPFHVKYDPYSRSVSVDKAIVRAPYGAEPSAY